MLICPAGGSVASDEPSAECPVEGDLIHWVADYCMASIGTDDEIAASDCIDSERRRVFDGECAAKLHYKRAMYELAVKYHSRPAPIAACVADRSFMGHTVRNRGIGGLSVAYVAHEFVPGVVNQRPSLGLATTSSGPSVPSKTYTSAVSAFVTINWGCNCHS